MTEKKERVHLKNGKLWNWLIRFANQNIGRKLTCLMVPAMCIIMATTVVMISRVYSGYLVTTIEEETSLITDTFKWNMDSCMSDVKSFLNALSVDQDVKNLATMDMEDIDYAAYLSMERNVKSLLTSMISTKSYIRDVFILGENGYQYNYMRNLTKNIYETKWFLDGVDREKKGFQYVLPHTADYYTLNSVEDEEVLSVVLPIRNKEVIVGYVACDLEINTVANFSETGIKQANVKIYLEDGETGKYYDFQMQETSEAKGSDLSEGTVEETSGILAENSDYIVYTEMENAPWNIVAVYPYAEIIAPAKISQRIGILMLLIACAMIFAVAFLIAGFIRRPINQLIERIGQVEEMDFHPVENTGMRNQPGEIVLIRNRFEDMIARIDELVHKVYLDQIYQKNMEYENLVNQVNPHFIYNVLQLIQSKAVLSGNEEIEDIVVDLSRLMRYTMSNRNRLVTIREECAYIESYLELYERRYSNKFSHQIILEKDLETYPVLKFILQPVVENCVKHGFKNLKRKGMIRIHIFREEGKIFFVTEDNGNGISSEKLAHLTEYVKDTENEELDSIGLKNTYQRIRLTYGEEAGMDITSTENEYTRVCCCIPEGKEEKDV